MARRWTAEDRRALMEGVGVCGWAWLQARVGRSWDLPGLVDRSRGAIREKIRREVGSGGITRGSLSLRQVMAETGYGRIQLLRAARALNQRWKRTAVGGVYLILEDQVEDLVRWLAHDYWGPHVYRCAWCGEAQGQARTGLCPRCYYRFRRRLLSRHLPATVRDLYLQVRAFVEERGLVVDESWRALCTRLDHGLAPLRSQMGMLWAIRDAGRYGQ